MLKYQVFQQAHTWVDTWATIDNRAILSLNILPVTAEYANIEKYDLYILGVIVASSMLKGKKNPVVKNKTLQGNPPPKETTATVPQI